MVEYTIYIYNFSGTPLGIVHNYSDISVAQVVNGYDVMNMTVPYESPYVSSLTQGNVLEVYRQDVVRGVPLTKVFSGRIQSTSYEQTQQRQWSIVAFGWEHVLTYRVIAWDEGKEGRSAWTDTYLTNIVADILYYNFGEGATLVGDTERATNGQIIDFATVKTADLNNGDLLNVDGVSYNNCLLVIQDLCTPDYVRFKLERRTTGRWDFYIGKVGYDVKPYGTYRAHYLTFSAESDTIASLRVSQDYTQYTNTAIVRGMGSGNSVVRVTRKTASSISGIAQREQFLDDPTSSNDTTLLNRTGDTTLAQVRQNIQTIDITINDQAPYIFGRDYFVGDVVRIDNEGLPGGGIVVRVNGVTMRQDSSNVETISIDLVEDEVLVPPFGGGGGGIGGGGIGGFLP